MGLGALSSFAWAYFTRVFDPVKPCMKILVSVGAHINYVSVVSIVPFWRTASRAFTVHEIEISCFGK